eukprot:8604284-Ditylum_brightwellii.AAC.1
MKNNEIVADGLPSIDIETDINKDIRYVSLGWSDSVIVGLTSIYTETRSPDEPGGPRDLTEIRDVPMEM